MKDKKLSRVEHPMFNIVDLMKSPVEQFLYYDMGFRCIWSWPKWVDQLIDSHAEDDMIYEESILRCARMFEESLKRRPRPTSYTPSNLRNIYKSILLDRPRHIRNSGYEVSIFSPYRSTDELNYFMCNSKVIIPAFRKHGFIPHVTPSLYHKNMHSYDGGIYGSLVFIRVKTSR